MKPMSSILLLLTMAALVVTGCGPIGTKGAVTLTFSMEIGTNPEQTQAYYTDLFKQYMEKHPNITIKFEPFIGDYDEYVTKLLVNLKAGTGPDIFTTTGSTLVKFAKTGTLAAAPPEVVSYIKKEALNQAVQDAVTGQDGKVYGLPWTGDWPALFYNIDMFQRAGIANPPTNWQELRQAAEKLTKYDDKGNMLIAGFFVRKSGAQLGIFEKWYPFFTAAGGKLFDDKMTQAMFNSPEGVEALQFYADLVNTYKVDSFKAPQGDTKGFLGGQVAMYIREPGNIARFKSEAPNMKFGTALIPGHKTTAKSIANIDAAVVPKASKNQKAAWDLLMWLSSPEISTDRYKTLVRQPLFKSAAQDPFFRDDKLMQPFMKQEAHSVPSHAKSYEIETAIGKYVEMVLQQKMGAKEALDAAAKEVNELLKEE